MSQIGYVYSATHRDRGRKIDCVKALLNRYQGPRPSAVIEPFGGVGTITALIRERWPRISPHIAIDISVDCVVALMCIPGIHAWRADFLIEKDRERVMRCATKGSLISLDMSYWTALSLHNREVMRAFEDVIAAQPSLIQLTDTSVSKLHLNGESYRRVLGCATPTYPVYIDALSREFQSRFGYSITDHERHVRATYIFMEPMA